MADWRIRPYREGDIPALVALTNSINRAYDTAYTIDEDEYRRQLLRSGLEPDRFMLVVEAPQDDEAGLPALVGSARFEPSDSVVESKQTYEIRLGVHPSLEGRGMEQALRDNIVQLIRDKTRDAGTDLDGVVIQAVANDRVEWRKALWNESGLKEVRRFYNMKRSLDVPVDEPEDVPGLILRKYRSPEDDQPALEAGLASFADHYGFSAQHFREEWEHWNNLPDTKHDLSWVAVAQDRPGEIAGFCISYEWQKPGAENGLDRSECLITYVGTIREWRCKGVAHNLLLHTLRSLQKAGFGDAILNVDSDSPTRATRVYEAVGFYITECFILYEALLRVVLQQLRSVQTKTR